MLAPNHVNAPATIHTSSMPPKLGTARLTSDGWTKIDEPTIVPTTIAVACVSPMERASFSGTARIVSPQAPPLRAGGRSIDLLDGREGIGFGRGLVGAIPFDAREAEGEAAGVLRARLHVVEGGFDVDLRPH